LPLLCAEGRTAQGSEKQNEYRKQLEREALFEVAE
jgi:hypothetical protein